MLLPNSENAYVPNEKLAGYLLSESHAVGRTKARFFLAQGYDTTAPEQLKRDLLEIARDNAVEQKVSSPQGTKYVVSGDLKTPKGKMTAIGTVWIV